MYLTTLRIISGPPGYCDTDYEELRTAEWPTDEELREFVRVASESYSDVRRRSTHTVKLDA